MTTIVPSPLLRTALTLDAAVSAVAAIAMLGATDLIAGMTLLPATLLRGAGLVMLPWVLLLALASRRSDLPVAGVWSIVAGNVAWSLASVAILLLGVVTPNLLGHAFVVAQAVAVLVFAELQYFGLRRALPHPA